MAYLYRHIRLDKNEPFYIGIGSDTDGQYERAYENQSCRRNPIWNKIAAKTEIEVEIVIDNLEWEDAKLKEIEFIKLYGRRDINTGILANMTDGGDGTVGMVRSLDYRKKLSEACKGKKIPADVIAKIAAKHRGHKWTDEQKKNLRDLKKSLNLKLSPSHIAQMSARMVGENNPHYGLTGTTSPNFKGFIQAFKDDKLVGEYEGVHVAAKELNVQATKISAVLIGKRNHTGGYVFKRLSNQNIS